MRKARIAAFAVGCALWAVFQSTGALTPEQVRLYGHESVLPLAIAVLYTSGQNDHGQVSGLGNAALVDADLGLYLTAAHVISEDTAQAWIGHYSMHDLVPVRYSSRWINVAADLAVVQVINTRGIRHIAAFDLATGPPLVGQMLTVKGYHRPSFRWRLGERPQLHGFVQPYQVLKSAADYCFDDPSCKVLQRIRRRLLLLGMHMDAEEERLTYPRYIYVVHRDDGVFFGIIPGMSGAPVFDAEGRIAAVVSAYMRDDPRTKHGMFSPGYEARALLEQARKDACLVP